jgi:signal transduction histidine kinase
MATGDFSWAPPRFRFYALLHVNSGGSLIWITEATMSVVTLRKLATQLPGSLLASFREPERSLDDDLIDLSALVDRQSELSPSGFAWVEIPLLGADGGITGVLCRNTGVGFPDNAHPRIERDAAQAYAHDLGNLLTVIDGGLRLLGVKTDAADRALIVERLHKAVQRGAALSRKLLDGSHAGEEGSRHPPSGHEQIVDVSDLLDRTLRADVVVETDIDPSLRCFRADPEQLHLALLNLCKNASDAMPDGGTISILGRNLCALSGSSWVEIAVADEGVGMRPDVLSQMFDPYFTTKAPGKGTGLGLAEVKRFVERSGGMIAAESAENVGTNVRMFFPCD